MEWKVSIVVQKCHFISHLKYRQLISKGCIHYLVKVNDSRIEALYLQSIFVVNEFLEVFSNDYPRVLLNRKIEFWIDVLHDTQPISVLPCIMAPAKLKEFKVNHNDPHPPNEPPLSSTATAVDMGKIVKGSPR